MPRVLLLACFGLSLAACSGSTANGSSSTTTTSAFTSLGASSTTGRASSGSVAGTSGSAGSSGSPATATSNGAASNGSTNVANSAASNGPGASGSSISASVTATAGSSSGSPAASVAASTSSSSGATIAVSATASSGATSSSGGASTGGGAFAYCPAPTNFANDNGDLGEPCTPTTVNGDAGQGTCSPQEICLDYGVGPVCAINCSESGCPGSSTCNPLTLAGGGSEYLCVPSCVVGGTACPSGMGCFANTPSSLDPGVCFPPCTSAASCNGADAGTTFVCTAGTCLCTHDGDCINGAVCDVPTGVCYFGCSASNNPSCTINESPVGCCAESGAGVGYCDFEIPATGWAGGAFGPDAGFTSVPALTVANEGVGEACGYSDGGANASACASGQLCEDLGWGPVCTFDCTSNACPGTSLCYIVNGSDLCLAACSAGGTGCGTGASCWPNSPNPSDPGYCWNPCTSTPDCNAADAGTEWTCTNGFCGCGRDSDCALGQQCDVASGSCYVPCGPSSGIGCTTLQGICAETGAVGYCDYELSSNPSFTVGAHTAWPSVFNEGGGPVLPAPELVTITFNAWSADGVQLSYPFQEQVEEQGAWIVTSSWLSTIGADYGVGLGNATARRLNETPPAYVDDSSSGQAIQAFLNARITSGTLPEPTANTIYAIYYPFSTELIGVAGTQGCVGFDAYHAHGTSPGGVIYTYLAIPDCGDSSAYGWSVAYGWAGQSSVFSHEVAEAATDPQGTSWYEGDTTSAWGLYSPLGNEVADMCINSQTHWIDPVTGYLEQRIWSPTAALGNGSPCVPVLLGEPFAATSGPATLLAGAAGTQVTVPYQSWSTAPVPAWTVYLAGWSEPASDLDISPASATTQNSGSGSFTLTIPANAASGSTITLELIAAVAPGVDTLWWPVVISVQ